MRPGQGLDLHLKTRFDLGKRQRWNYTCKNLLLDDCQDFLDGDGVAPTPQERKSFGKSLRDMRHTRTLQEMVDWLRDEKGFITNATQLSAWERGEYAPKTAELVEQLDSAVGADGWFLRRLGYLPKSRPGPPRDAAEVAQFNELDELSRWAREHPDSVKIGRVYRLGIDTGYRRALNAIEQSMRRDVQRQLANQDRDDQFAVAADTGKATKPAKSTRQRPSPEPNE